MKVNRQYLKDLLHQFTELPFWGVLTVAILVYLYLINIFPPHIVDDFICESWCGKACAILYDNIASSIGVGWLTFVAFLLISIYITYSLFKRGFRITTLIILVSLAIWMWIDTNWIYPIWICNSNFKWWIFATICFDIIMLMILLVREFITSLEHNNVESSHIVNGFSTDELGESDDISRSYAESIIGILKATDCTSSAYALGLASPWGTGKTSMISLFKASLSDAIVMEYNPWICLTEKSLIKDFFDRLANLISKEIDSSLYSPIIKYGESILAIEGLGSWFSTLKNYFNDTRESSLLEMKSRIAQSLKKAGKRLYIFIDDMDRLDDNEVFEILKLIRNTADFPNIIYIVAYDKEYVISQLINKGISNASQYIEKIFNIEINIPVKTSAVLQLALKAELSTMFPEDAYLLGLPMNLIKGQLNSFREVKRFARQFYVNRMFMDENVGIEEYDVSDFFIIELIRYKYQDVYDDLVHNISKIFQTKLINKGVYVISIKKEYEKDHTLEIDGHLPLLRSLIKENENSTNAFRYVSRFRRYLTFSIDSDEVTRNDFINWLDATEESAQGILENLINKANGRRSLYFQFAIAQIGEYSLNRLKRFFSGLLYIWFDSSSHHRTEVTKILSIKFRACESAMINTDDFFEIVSSYITQYFTIDYIKVSELCKMVKCSDIALSERMKSLEEANFSHFLDSNEVNPLDMLNPNSDLKRLYTNSIVWRTEFYGQDEEGNDLSIKIGQTTLINILCSHFEMCKSCNRREFISSICSYEAYDPYGEPYIEYLPEEQCEDEIRHIFGNRDYYDRFISSAFLP